MTDLDELERKARAYIAALDALDGDPSKIEVRHYQALREWDDLDAREALALIERVRAAEAKLRETREALVFYESLQP